MEEKRSLQSITDDELLQRLAELTSQSRRVEVDIVAHIAEVDERRLYAREAFPSMFVYCTDALHLSEPEAYLRIAAARASREHPILLSMLADGRLHLTAIGKLAPHLTRENRDGLLERATHKSKRQIEELIAEIVPRPDVPAIVRKLPDRRLPATPGRPLAPTRGEGSSLDLGPYPAVELGPDPTLQLRPDAVVAPEPEALADEAVVGHDARSQAMAVGRAASTVSTSPNAASASFSCSVVLPLSPGRYKVQFTATAEFNRKLERLRALVGKGPGGDLAAVIEQAVTEKLERLEASRFARTPAPRKGRAETERSPDASPSSRHIPAAVRRAVFARDGGRCRYVDEKGRRCPERDRLEYHHGHPFGLGGHHGVTNVRLMCRAHNRYLADCDYGKEAMARHRRPRNQAPRSRPASQPMRFSDGECV